MEQLRKDVTEVIVLESLNAQRIDKLSDAVLTLRETVQQSGAALATALATQSQALGGFRELYAREIAFLHQSLSDMRCALAEIRAGVSSDKDKIVAVERDIAVTRGSIRGAVMSWSGFVALVAFIVDKAVELLGKK